MFSENSLYVDDIDKISRLNIAWEKLHHSSILITGATGMIGTFLVDVLMKRNCIFSENIHIYAMGRSADKARARFKDYFQDQNFTFITKDVNDEYLAQDHYDYIIHCASNTHPQAYAAEPVNTILTNVLGTNHILQMAVKGKTKRVLFLSSVEIYGETKDGIHKFTEEYCGYINCNTLRAGYPESKRTGESLCQAYIQEHGLDVVIPRICRVFGPTMLETDTKALSQFIKNAVNKEDIVLKSEGRQYYSYCYVGDVVSALLYILFYGENGMAYNVADEKSDICLKDLARILADFAGTNVTYSLPGATEQRGFSTAVIALLDSCRLKRLGWQANNGINDNLIKTCTILRSLGIENHI